MSKPATLLTLYAFFSFLELYLFLLQRVALQVARAAGFDSSAVPYMLPAWYAPWTVRLSRWVLLFGLWKYFGAWETIVAVALVFVATTFCPLPRRHALPIIARATAVGIARLDSAAGISLMAAVDRAFLDVFCRPFRTPRAVDDLFDRPRISSIPAQEPGRRGIPGPGSPKHPLPGPHAT